jgi:hypothetical protein
MIASERERRVGAGCLVWLGTLVLWPALIVTWGFAGDSMGELQSALRSLQWTTLAAFWKSWLALFRPAPGSSHVDSLFLVMIVTYFAMMWQWVAHLSGWRTWFPARRLWAVSSGYFVVVGLASMNLCRPLLRGSMDAEGTAFLIAAALWIVIAWMVPAVFLAITVPLWLSTPAPKAGAKGGP